MIIKPSTALRNGYNEISKLCKDKKVPVYLTKNGEGDLVVLDIETYEKEKVLLELKEKLLEAEEQRINGDKTYSLEEIRARFISE